jgi:hypothetical protein
MKTLAVIPLAVAWLLASPAPVGYGQTWTMFANPRLGHTVRLPPGWRATVRPADGVTVITSIPVLNRNDSPERIALTSGGVYIWIFDYGRVRGDFPRRPSRIELGTSAMHTCGFGDGYMVRFRGHGRLLQIFVKLGSRADPGVVLAVLDSLRVTRRAAAV